MADTTENTRINPKHYIGKIADNEGLFLIGSLVLTGALGFVGATNLYDSISEKPDTIGTAQQDATYKTLTASIDKLDKQQTSLEIAQKQYELNALKGDINPQNTALTKTKINDLQKEFSLNAYSVLTDLYTHGIIGEEADISETQVLELSKVFTDKIAPPSEFGVNITANKIAYLDEARIEMAENNDNDNLNYLAQFKEINTIMQDKKETPEVLTALATMLGGVGFFFLMVLGVHGKLNDWSRENKQVPKRNKKLQNNH